SFSAAAGGNNWRCAGKGPFPARAWYHGRCEKSVEETKNGRADEGMCLKNVDITGDKLEKPHKTDGNHATVSNLRKTYLRARGAGL
ncbi:hypothetical protein, partial [Anaerotruncus massiliensis (ex Liu et al. 2021)]|uniref:hypothetical protein n=1 Tax=Anaerotruncus massiliensis (ex Liu et al. 2021) TaxID=2321404 RepID=UPI003AB1E845